MFISSFLVLEIVKLPYYAPGPRNYVQKVVKEM